MIKWIRTLQCWVTKIHSNSKTMVYEIISSIPSKLSWGFSDGMDLIVEISYMKMKGIQWFSWDKLSLPKQCEGLPFRNLCAFNIVSFANQHGSSSCTQTLWCQGYWRLGNNQSRSFVCMKDVLWLHDGQTLQRQSQEANVSNRDIVAASWEGVE